jgi:PrtD family type I secretion system ABC transporter
MPRDADRSRAGKSDAVSDALGAVRGHLGFALLLSAAVNTLFLASPLYMMQLYGRVLDSRSIETLISLSVALLLALVALAGADAVRGRLLARAAARIDRRLAEPAARRALAEGKGQAGPALEDVETVRRFLGGSSATTLLDAPFTLMFLVILYLLHPALGLVATFGAAAILATVALARLVEAQREARIGDGSREIARLSVGLDGDRGEIRALGLELGLAARLTAERRGVGTVRQAVGEMSASVGASARFVRMAAHSGALAAGAVLALNDQMSPSAMLAAAILAGRALGPVETLSGAWRHALAARDALARLRGRLDGAAESEAAPPPVVRRAGAAVEVCRLVAQHPGAPRPALRALSFTVAPGETISIAGSSGAGKTTLARCLVGAERPRGGEVRIDGASAAAIAPSALARSVGWLPQEAPLFAGTVRDNIARFGKASDAEVRRAARRAGALAAIERLPRGFDTEVGIGGRDLSPSVRQTVALARALSGDPGLVVLDQPTAHMDAEGEVATINAIRGLKADGVTAIVISHKPVLAALADRIMLLEEGVMQLFEEREAVLTAIRRQSLHAVAGPAAADGGVAS